MSHLSIIEAGFPEADAPWLPTLLDLEYRKSEGVPGYANIGFDNLVLDATEHPLLTSAWSRLTMRFNNRYANRMLNAETLQGWQVRLQNRLDEIADEYERAFRLYSEYSERMDRLEEGWENKRIVNTTHGGTDTDRFNSTRRFADTPDSIVNELGDYGSSVGRTNDTSSRDYGRTEDKDDTLTHVQTGLRMQMNIVKSFKSWVDLDTAFVAEFENNFLNIFWY